MYEDEYVELKSLIAKMTSISSSMITDSLKALVERNSDLAQKIIKTDDIVDNLDIKIDEHCMKMLALLEPKASDLRYILTASKIMMDLERVGDYSVDICRNVIEINKVPQVKPYIDLPKMAELASNMLKDSIASFFNKDLKLAKQVIISDDVIDNLNHQIIRELFTYIAEDMRKTKAVISLIQISSALERIADHATNIAELVFYIVEGKIIRHKSYEEF
jgi:phosphate transport system protein